MESSLILLFLPYPISNLPVDSVVSTFKTSKYKMLTISAVTIQAHDYYLLPWLFSQPPLPLWRVLNIAASSDMLKHKFHGIWHKNHVICLFKSFQWHPISLRETEHLQWPARPSLPSSLQPQLLPLFLSLVVSSHTVLHAVSQIHSGSWPLAVCSGVPLTRTFFPLMSAWLIRSPFKSLLSLSQKGSLTTLFNPATCTHSTTPNPLTLL